MIYEETVQLQSLIIITVLQIKRNLKNRFKILTNIEKDGAL